MGQTSLYLIVLTLLTSIVRTDQNARQKRQILADQPRIITENGNLIFQSGANHNITFRSASGGVFVDNLDLKNAVAQTQTNKVAIDGIHTSLGSRSVTDRFASLENELRGYSNLAPTVNNLSNVANNLRIQIEDTRTSFNARLVHVETRLANLPNISAIQSSVTELRNRVHNLENRNTGEGGGGGGSAETHLQNRVTALEETVRSLQALLTTNECMSNPCLHGGSCVDMYNNYLCRCPPSWQGPRCTEDVNECAVYAGTDLGCQNGATCINSYGSFSCQCSTNWYGIHCSEQHNDCHEASHMELCGHGTCVDELGQVSYRCICETGWTQSSSGPACTADVDECATGTHCSVNPLVQCINIPGSFVCGSCPPGYTGNGHTCSDINECTINNGGCSMSPRVDCFNTIGSRACGPCPAGYQGDGVSCTYVGFCAVNNGGCHPLATCSEASAFGRFCSCPIGYFGSGVGPSGCLVQSQAGACASNPCQNGAVCAPMGITGFTCACRPGFSGPTCSVVVDACLSNPCQNGGTCVSQTQAPGYSCQCTADFTGTNCQVTQEECGDFLHGQAGSFRYPRNPGSTYSHRVSCVWVISTSPDKILNITFQHFILEYHPECNFDFLQIHDGSSPSSYMIGKYCGNNPPNGGSLNSTHNQLYFWFKSDATIADDGFQVNWTSQTPSCGGYLSGSDHGIISSPGYPGNYPHNRDCAWTVAVSPGSNIMFSFAHLALEQHQNCSYDYLEIRDGELDDATPLGRFCSSVTPAPIQTTGPYAFIRFHSDFSLSDRGFHITYAALTANRQGCGGVLSGSDGEVMSPGYPQPYRHDIQCVWVITVAPGSSVQLTFLEFDMGPPSSCAFVYLAVRDGSDQMAPTLTTLCGRDLPAVITSSGNIMNLEFHTNSSNSGQGFKAEWTTACGGVFSGQQGLIQSPNWPAFYPHNKICDYRIEVPDFHTIRFHFNAFGLEILDDDCTHDYIEIHDGSNQGAPMIGSRLCGQATPADVMSTGNELFVKFVTDSSSNNLGFQATFTAVEGGCGGVLNSDSGIITSPGHPNEYPHGANCTWYINVTPGLVIRLTFNSFHFESPRINTCVYDYVEIYDNSTMAVESLLGRYCGQNVPQVVTSTDNVLVVYMRSDDSLAREGFHANYAAINASRMCGSTLTAATGVITSPNYPNSYPHNRQCEWTITISDGNQIDVNITDLDIEQHTNCNFDYLEIRNGGYLSSPLMQKFCGQVIPHQALLSHSNRLYLKFKSDSSSTGRGFRLEYTSGTSGCGGDLTTPTGGIVSPNYPEPYSHNAQCFWTITVSQGSAITLFFVDFDVEEAGQCYYDYLEVRDGGPSGRLHGKFCGTNHPDPITTTSNRLWLTYRSDGYVSGRGFRLQYQSSCNRRLTGNSGVIESPNFPNLYNHRTNCIWIIEVPIGNAINVSFAAFKLENHTSCRYDYLQIRDGGSSSDRVLANLCGDIIPDPIHSTGSQLWLNFVTDISQAHEGFRLEWVVDGCGGNLYSSTGTITSPNYPNPYPHRRECQWIITVPTGNSIQITISTFDLETSTNCVYDVLEIYAGRDSSGPRLTQLCHRQTHEQILHATGTTAFVRFRSDSSVSGRGFSLNYTAASGGCGGNFTARTATITSIHYPQNYEHNTECEWNITVAPGHVVVLNFSDFDVESSYFSSSCPYDYVNLYDGADANATLIASLCGSTLSNRTVYRSNGNQMFVRMQTDSSSAHRGFSATYTTGCGGTLNADTNGEIFSPGYPGRYPWNTMCVWIISSSLNNRRVSLTFTHMDIQGGEGCTRGYVSVANGLDPIQNQTGALQNQYCGSSVPATITSQGSALIVVFRSTMRASATGFRAVYTSAYSACGGEFTAQSGTFMSPFYPGGYPVNIECVWNIRSSPGNQLQITFPDFQLDPLGDINDDYVEIRSPNVSGAIVGRWTQANAPENVTSLYGAWVKFRSNEGATAPGFVAEYSTSYGGDLVGDSGQIASPQYPGFYPADGHYRWTILVSQNLRIRVSFSVFALERRGQDGVCHFDHVQIFDGTEQNGVSLGTFCGTTIPDPLYSETNQITVVFTSDSNVQDTGFLLDWLAVTSSGVPVSATVAPGTAVPSCGGQRTATDVQQNFTSPGYPSYYQNNLYCTWTISAPEGHTVVMNITYIDLEGYGRCPFDRLRFQDGIRIIGTYCGQIRNTGVIQSTGNTMNVLFHTDYSVTGRGFVVTYQIGCGGVMQSPTGVVTSFHYPNNYPANENCTWQVRVLPGKTIRLDFADQFNIADTGDCNNDYLLLLNGYSSQSPPLYMNGSTNTNGRYCGSSKPPRMETSSNFLLANFVSDGSDQETGFSFTYSSVSLACGGQLRLTDSVTSGYFTSPNYPANYPHNVDCVWLIIAPASKRIQVDFEGNFSIEAHRFCVYDYVEFHDGGTTNSPRIGDSLCGNNLPGTVFSTGNVLLARFHTDTGAVHAGFNAKYSIATCGGRIIATNGIISSPNYPANYGNNLNCEWTIAGPVGHFLRFNITGFRLQSSPNCTQDWLEIRDGNSTDTILFRGCQSWFPHSVETTDSAAFIRFQSDGSVTNKGFQLVFQASVEECGGQLNTPSGVLTSPNFPGQYPHGRLCTWDITVPLGRRVTLTFNDLRLEGPSYRCYWDYVQVIDGFLPGSPSRGRFCGENLPTQAVESSGNTMRVLFRTDGSVSNGGFRATYTSDREAECGGLVTESSGNITSPGYENNTYGHNIECIWRLNRHSVNGSIRLNFRSISMEYHTACAFDFVEIREGADSNAALVNRFCDLSRSSEPLVIPGNDAWIMFRTDYAISTGGFRLEYMFTDCGGIVTEPDGFITSPNYPSLFEDSIVGCVWRIIAPEGTKIWVNFTEFAYPEQSSCLGDSLQIQNGGLPDSPVIDKYCGSKRPGTFLSQSSELRLTMKSTNSTGGRKFRMAYRFRSEGCGGLFHSNQGSFSSLNFPSSYPHNTECRWDITVQNGYVVTLHFNPPFDLEARDCARDHVEVFDVLSNDTLISLGRWCHNLEPPDLRSTSPKMVVVFQSDATTNGNGFSASWDVACGGVLTNPSGELFSPGYPNLYPNNLMCNYTIIPGSNHHIGLSFQDFELEGGWSCQHDYFLVWQGNITSEYNWWYSANRQLGRFCGTTRPDQVVALGQMTIQFRTDYSLQYKGFRAQYISEECGGVFTEPTGVISTPIHPNNYVNNMDCSWNITVSPGKIIRFKFTSFDVEYGWNCNYDSVTFYDGFNTSAQSIGRYCGRMQSVPQFISSTGNNMYIRFTTDISAAGRGFSGGYSSTYGPAQGCGGVLQQSNGTFASVDADNDGLYENDLECQWLIIVGDNRVVTLSINDLALQTSDQCQNDYLKIYDGMSQNDQLLGTYCGSTFPQSPIQTSSNVMFVVFHTDDSGSAAGFHANFTETNATCGGAYNAASTPQTITSPNYPNSTGIAVLCSWIIDSGNSYDHVRIRVTDLQLQATPSCQNEYLNFRDRPMGTAGQERSYCGDVIPPIFESIGRRVKITYNLLSTTNTRGFQLTYQIADCNQNFSQSSGRLTSPGFPGVYPHSVYCTIQITSPVNTTLALYFASFHLEAPCRWDYLEVRNSSSTTGVRYCGSMIPSPIFMTNNVATLRFRTDSSIAYNGYDMTFLSSTQGPGCGGNITGQLAGVFTSPLYPDSVSDPMTCSWYITPPAQHAIYWWITSLGSSPVNDCSNNVAVYGGFSETDPLISRYCAHYQSMTSPQSTSSPLMVQYVAIGNSSTLTFKFEFSTDAQTFHLHTSN